LAAAVRPADKARSASLKPFVRAPYNGCVIAQPLCVLCEQRPAEDPWRPFCSERCKLVDLTRWLDGVYRVPGESVPASEQPDDTHTDGEEE